MNERNIKPISPFILFCQKVIPLAFDESMSYYECLCALYDYLHNQVTPAVNNNADAVTELQKYVANYFDNLDVQDEINNKLDEMAESGELAEIIAQYVELGCVFGYDTISNLSDADNLIDGSIAYTLGQNAYDDGKGAYYKIRQITVTDVIDGYNIVAITSSQTLIAERISDKRMDDAENEIEEIKENLNKRRFILIGDSFAVGIDGDNNTGPAVAGGGWANRFKTLMSDVADVYFNEEALGGVYGFASSMPFLTVLQATGQDIENKNTITDIVVLGGTNDLSHTSDLNTAISSFMTYCKNTYPNAKVKIGCLGTDISNIVSLGNYYRLCENYGGEYINDTKGLLCLKEYIGTDGTHLNSSGYTFFQPYINQAILTGHVQFNFVRTSDLTLVSGVTADYGTIKVEEQQTQNTYCLRYYRADNYQAPIFSYNNTGGDIDFVAGTYENKIKLVNPATTCGFGARIRVHESNYLGGYVSNFKAYGTNGNLHLWSSTLITASGSTTTSPNRYCLLQQDIKNVY